VIGDQWKRTRDTLLHRNRGRNPRRDRGVEVYRLANAAAATTEQNRRPGARIVPVIVGRLCQTPLCYR
jgi:hypothetical protein